MRGRSGSPALTTVDQYQRRARGKAARVRTQDESLHGRNNAILAKQDCAAEQGAELAFEITE